MKVLRYERPPFLTSPINIFLSNAEYNISILLKLKSDYIENILRRQQKTKQYM